MSEVREIEEFNRTDVRRRAMPCLFGSPIPLSLNFCSIYKALIQKRIKAVTVEKRNEKWKETV